MKKIEVKILGLSYSQTQVGSYVVVLSEIGGARKLPIIIKPADAQTIALKIENMKTQRPLTHDLMRSVTDAFNITAESVFISHLVEGIFYAKLKFFNHMDEVEIECNIGDAIALALTYACPIFVSDDVLTSAGIFINDDGTSMSEDEIEEAKSSVKETKSTKTKTSSIEDLEDLLKRAVQNEEYDVAAQLRDRIKELKG